MPPEERHRITAEKWRVAGRDFTRDTQQSSREMRHGKRLLKASTRVRDMETVLIVLKDLTILDVFFLIGITHTGVLH